MGTATSAQNYVRQIGASVGIAVFGSVFISRLTSEMAGTPIGGAQGGNISSLTPEVLAGLPEAVQRVIAAAFSTAMPPLFLYAVPVALAGLVFALAVYSKIDESNLLGDDVIAGTGSMDPDGNVGRIGGVREKIAGAEEDGASVFLLPEGNCDDVGGLPTTMRLVPVSTLTDAIKALQKINEGNSYAEVPTCG